MRLSRLDLFLETVEYTRGGEVLTITYDANAFTSEFFRGLSASMRVRMAQIEKEDAEVKERLKSAQGLERILTQFDEEARSIEVERDIYAEMLAKYVIKEWSATDDSDNPLPPTFENLQRLSPRALKELFRFLREYRRPLEQRIAGTPANPTILETIEDGSSAEPQAVENQTM